MVVRPNSLFLDLSDSGVESSVGHRAQETFLKLKKHIVKAERTFIHVPY